MAADTVAPVVDYPLFLDLARPSVAQAAAQWQPGEGTPPAQPFSAGGVPALRLACPFAKSGPERACWDVAVNLDLRLVRGIRFQFRCADSSPVGSFFCYLKSGGGWYVVDFSPKGAGGWETIEILKAQSRVEGTPGGWGRIETLRLAAGRGAALDAAVDVAGFGVIHPMTRIAVLRGVSAGGGLAAGDRQGVYNYCENVATALDAAGIKPAILDDVDASPELLRALQLVVLPYNPNMSEALTDMLVSYVSQGGRLVGFYPVPPRVAAALGIRGGRYISGKSYTGGLGGIVFLPNALPGAPDRVVQNSWNALGIEAEPGRSAVVAEWLDGAGNRTGLPAVVASAQGLWMSHVYLAQDAAAGPRMLAAMVGRYVPDAWPVAVNASLQNVARSLPYTNAAQAYGELGALVRGNDAAGAALQQATRSHQAATACAGKGDVVGALATADECRRWLEEAYCLAQKPLAGEFRAVWCHRGYGIEGLTWEQSVKHLANCGFNAIFPNMAWAGQASYRSAILPPDATCAERGDQLQPCLEACRRNGVQLHVWKVCFNLGDTADDMAARMRAAGRVQRDIKGRVMDHWLCPSDPENQRLEAGVCQEIVTRYAVDGILLDYIRYPGADTCFCDGCRQRFEVFLGRSVSGWPNGVRSDPAVSPRWLEFRRQNITVVVQSIRQAVKAVRPEAKLSAAVYPNWVSARDSLAQDWADWCRKGYLDFVCPMDYFQEAQGFDGAVRRQLSLVQGTRTALFPGIGLRSNESHLSAPELIAQINVTRQHRTGGFIVFEYNRQEATTILPQLAKGATRR
ncbi:MAG: hypothetical protein A3K19_33560 [Lentisphaerae bacterium RIFOXYB12_FULL_65_16]|nr:MAG: hypothetical protein A3K18_26290 [Lentisphaerae bacterium RIFOXYA12_64_32]OGV88372.1 MAG: hypothetical protein A3K19_33560 [Lentisphaerae bacterium RIFOXYB12_FULL_65_16]